MTALMLDKITQYEFYKSWKLLRHASHHMLADSAAHFVVGSKTLSRFQHMREKSKEGVGFVPISSIPKLSL